MKNERTYPKEVVTIVEQMVQSLIDEEIFEDNDVKDIELGKQVATNIFSEYLLERFLKGETLLFESEDKCDELFTLVITNCYLENLINLGLLGSYIDETMEEDALFVTEKGRQYVRTISESRA